VQHQLPASAPAMAMGPRRPLGRKKIPKVPSSFVERQEKLKVSKRKGPLQERQREKTHTMRKTKRICVRCRFYKSGVSILWFLSCTANASSVMRATHAKNAKRLQVMRDPFASRATESIWKTPALSAGVCAPYTHLNCY
jgi:hypothetical protein